MARPTSNQSIEDYLEAILVIQQRNGHCRSVDVANHLGYTKASVSVAMSNLSRMDYVHKLADGNLVLTESGCAYATSSTQTRDRSDAIVGQSRKDGYYAATCCTTSCSTCRAAEAKQPFYT